MADDVVSRILALDARAEDTLARARQQATDIRYRTAEQLDEILAESGRRKAQEIAKLESEAARRRDAEVAKVRESFRNDAQAIRQVDPSVIQRAVAKVVSRVKGGQ